MSAAFANWSFQSFAIPTFPQPQQLVSPLPQPNDSFRQNFHPHISRNACLHLFTLTGACPAQEESYALGPVP
jgi:hypothetical protein